jgi:hypothetical protein
MKCSQLIVGVLLLGPPASGVYAGDFDTEKVRKACPGIAAWQKIHPDNMQTSPPHQGSDLKLVAELRKMVKEDQAARNFDPQNMNEEVFKRMQKVDRKDDKILRAIIQRLGVPTTALIGTDGMKDFWLLVQHADRDVQLQEAVLKKFSDGVSGASLPEVAYLTDRVRRNRGRPQLYGNQFESQNGGPLTLAETEDLAHLSERRQRMGLMPFEDYECGIKALYDEAPSAAVH